MRIFPVVVASLCLAATIGVSAAHADDDGWRRHEWREHHWRGEHRYRHHSAEPGQIYVERPRVYYAPPPVYYEPLPRAFGFAIGHEDDDDEE